MAGKGNLNLDHTGLAARIDWDTCKRAWRWFRTTVLMLGLGGGGYHVIETRAELADIRTRLARCEEIERRNTRLIEGLINPMPGNNPGSAADGPPVVPDKEQR